MGVNWSTGKPEVILKLAFMGEGVGCGGASGYALKDILKSRFVGGAIVAATHKAIIAGLNRGRLRWD